MKKNKPLGHKSYGSIPHLPKSRLGPADHKCSEGQAKIACEKTRDKHDFIILQEKLDGSNVGVVKINNTIIALTRAGYLANTSPYIQHHFFSAWVEHNKKRFSDVLKENERLCGEWMLVAHGTKYDLPHEPFVAFDLMKNKHERTPYEEFIELIKPGGFISPKSVYRDEHIPLDQALYLIGFYGFHGAIDLIEGIVYRVERDVLIDKSKGNAGGRKRVVDFLVKYVEKDKVDGLYLMGDDVHYNTHR